MKDIHTKNENTFSTYDCQLQYYVENKNKSQRKIITFNNIF